MFSSALLQRRMTERYRTVGSAGPTIVKATSLSDGSRQPAPGPDPGIHPAQQGPDLAETRLSQVLGCGRGGRFIGTGAIDDDFRIAVEFHQGGMTILGMRRQGAWDYAVPGARRRRSHVQNDGNVACFDHGDKL